MFSTLLVLSLFGLMNGFRITSKVDSTAEPESVVSSNLPPYRRSLDPPYPDHTTYDAIFSGAKKPLAVDCTQPGVICKFPLVLAGKDNIRARPAKHVNEVPIIKGAEAISESTTEVEARDSSDKKEEMILDIPTIDENGSKLQIYKGSIDVESINANEKDVEGTWILEKNTLNRRYQIPVKLVPSKHNHDHETAPTYPVYHDFHDHFGGGDYHYPSNRHGSGWTPWMRAYPSVYNYPSHQPCQPPVYHHSPPPCSAAITPTKKPTINIDDKIDKDEY